MVKFLICFMHVSVYSLVITSVSANKESRGKNLFLCFIEIIKHYMNQLAHIVHI